MPAAFRFARAPLHCEAVRREEAYHEPHLSEAPPLLVVMDDFRCLQRAGVGKGLWTGPSVAGWHSRHGVFIACGPDIACDGKRVADASILDVTLTVLHFMGLPVPVDADGRVVREMLATAPLPGRQPERYEESQEGRRVKAAAKRLRRSGSL